MSMIGKLLLRGPLYRYSRTPVFFADVEPAIFDKWIMSRGALIKLGLRCIVHAIRPGDTELGGKVTHLWQ